jgi:serine/threonine protein kinase
MIGSQLGKTYHIIDKIDEGGMGVVYQVEHQTLRKRFAAKVLAAGLAANPEALRRFEIEAHAASKLEHENIVNVTDYGVADDGRPYLVMELLKGKTLYQRLREGPLSLQETVAVIVPVCHALTAAHAEGFIHRDVKPENIFLTQRPLGRFGIKVLDFGITRLRAESSRLTKMGQALGSPFYMAPETCRGDAIDHRADIYSLGVLLYQLLCGQLPFHDDNLLKVIQLQVAAPLRPPRDLVPDISDQLDRVICKALEKDPADRYQSIEELEDDLLAALPPDADALLHARRTPLGVPAVITSPTPTSVATSSGALPAAASTTASIRRALPRPALVAGAALLLLGGGAVVFLVSRGDDRPAPAPVTALPQPAAGDPPADPEQRPMRRVSVATRPAGASVTLDGIFLGTSPIEVEAPRTAAPVTLAIEAKGFRTAVRTAGGDEDIVLSLALEPAKPSPHPTSRRTGKQPLPSTPRPRTPSPAVQPDDQLDIRGAR